MTITHLVTDLVNPSAELVPNRRIFDNPFHNSNSPNSSWEIRLLQV